jgi:hypothetical protein
MNKAPRYREENKYYNKSKSGMQAARRLPAIAGTMAVWRVRAVNRAHIQWYKKQTE